MANHKLKFYPVGNGDAVLIKLLDDTTILIDCKLREGDEDNNGDSIFDVKSDLLKSLKKVNGIHHLDLFILTHPDLDHCHGFEANFYIGNPSAYLETDRENGLVIADELWVTSMLFDEASNEDAKALRTEAKRRLKLYHESNDPGRGNRLQMIGYNGDDLFKNVPYTLPGTTIGTINGEAKGMFEFFVHAPFKKSLVQESAVPDKNYSSIVMQARFKYSSTDDDFGAFYLFGGDADHYLWAEILKQSKFHNNEDRLVWDYFLAPHHCSWNFFNDHDGDGCDEPKDTALEILAFGRKGGKIVASCKEIKDNEDNPPNYDAKSIYVKKGFEFVELASPSEGKDAKPVEFEISEPSSKASQNSFNLVQKTFITAKAAAAEKPWASNAS